ncbi:hypothetical protein AVEN_120512-1 [Araneus ventricosus]|uniref:Uncharacterized protein n=1 Tax=Araneus ventricosus TaxID=182803 RepID=A0A4Y2MRB1_ARAVE|nr:hypothetical protein AVEN_120512-1 [Araneus ventricosus]
MGKVWSQSSSCKRTILLAKNSRIMSVFKWEREPVTPLALHTACKKNSRECCESSSGKSGSQSVLLPDHTASKTQELPWCSSKSGANHPPARPYC